MGANATARYCSTEAADWCGHGRCAEASELGLGVGMPGAAAFQCVCDEGWRGSVLQVDPEDPARCLLPRALMSWFFRAFLPASLVLLAVGAHAVRSGRLDHRRGAVLSVACVINALLSSAALAMPAVGPNSTLVRGGAALLFAIGTCAVLLFGPVMTLLTIEKYVKASKASAVRLSGQGQANEAVLTPGTVATLAFSFAVWGICCVLWAVAVTSNSSSACLFFLTVGASVVSLGWFTDTSISSLDRDVAFVESQVLNAELLDALAGLRRKLAQTRVSVVGPSAVLGLLTLLGAVLLAVPATSRQFSQQLDYVWFFWVPA